MKAIVFVASLGLGTVLASGCATLEKNETVCPEYRSLRCLTAPQCVKDAARGCNVCQCTPLDMDYQHRDRPPSSLPPDSNAHPGS